MYTLGFLKGFFKVKASIIRALGGIKGYSFNHMQYYSLRQFKVYSLIKGFGVRVLGIFGGSF